MLVKGRLFIFIYICNKILYILIYYVCKYYKMLLNLFKIIREDWKMNDLRGIWFIINI